MYLVDFMNNNSDWREKLAAAPYFLDVKNDDNGYYLLKYSMIMSDFTLPEVIEARGAIFRQDENGIWICVARGLDKFGNYGEAYASTNKIDWDEGVDILEKVDGSNIRLFYDKGDWHIATLGTISAFDASCGDTNFGDLFIDIIGRSRWNEFLSILNIDYCYYFELVSPTHNHIVVRYPEDRIYFLGARDMRTMEELDFYNGFEMDFPKIHYPKHYTYYSLADCIDAAHNLGVNEEGYVVVSFQKENNSFLRIKVKGDEYLALHKLRGNGALTILRVIEMWQNSTLDDFSAYYSEYQDFIESVMAAVRALIQRSSYLWVDATYIVNAETRKDFALFIKNEPSIIQGCLFALYDEKVENAQDYYKSMRSRNLASYIMTKTEQKEIGVVEDE